MTILARDAGEVEALVTDRYLDALLASGADLGPVADAGSPGGRRALDAAVRAASRRLAADLPRFHPSFRFEERLALRLAEAAAAMRLPLAAGSEGQVVQLPTAGPPDFDPLAVLPDDEGVDPRAALVRGAVAASAISLAGAAWLAWRRRTAVSPMARAARAAHGTRPPLGGAGRA